MQEKAIVSKKRRRKQRELSQAEEAAIGLRYDEQAAALTSAAGMNVNWFNQWTAARPTRNWTSIKIIHV
jgi:hypothetical protein